MDKRFRILMITLVGAVALATWTFPRWWPLVNQESVTAEIFPGLEPELQADFVALPDADKQIYFEILRGGDDDDPPPPKPNWARTLIRARLQGDDQLAPGGDVIYEPPDGSRILATGEFSPVDSVRYAEGEFTIYQLPDLSRVLRLDESFSSTRAPGVHLIFTRNPDPTDERGVGVDYIDIGVLQGNIGGQTYTVPESVDFSRYPVVALYVPQYDDVLATAPVRVR
jgi:hypothetical protein